MQGIKYSKKAKKFLEKCEEDLYKRLKEKIEKLKKEPYPSDCKRIKGRKEKVFRVRVGNNRILYVVFNEKEFVFIADIDKRSKIYND
ncbi:MAG: type II toxin-antitoxin system RelE family toxin [Nanoarchaeota archaeon]